MPDVYTLTSTGTEANRLVAVTTAFSQGERLIKFGPGDYYIETTFDVASDCAIPVSNLDAITVDGTDATIVLKWDPEHIEGSGGGHPERSATSSASSTATI